MAVFTYDGRICDYSLKLERQVVNGIIDYARFTNDFEVFRCCESERAVTRTHSFNQCRMRASHFSGMHVTVRVLLEGSIILTKNEAEEFYSLVFCALETRDVFLRIRCSSDDNKRKVRLHFFVSLYYQVSVVLWLKSTDIENVAIWREAIMLKRFRRNPASGFCAVGNHFRFLAPSSLVVILNYLGIGNYGSRNKSRKPFGNEVVTPPDPAPLLTLSFKAVDVYQCRRTEDTRDKCKDAVGCIAYKDHVVTARYGVKYGKKGVNNRIEVFVFYCWENNELNSAIG